MTKLGLLANICWITLGLCCCGNDTRSKNIFGTGEKSNSFTGFFMEKERWTTPIIPVCWEQWSSEFEVERQWVMQRVMETWAEHTVVDFINWGRCEKGTSPSVRIHILDTAPHTKALGRSLAGLPGGVILNFKFRRWKTDCARNDSLRKRCIETIALHEFGHIIGLQHEHLRQDVEPGCGQAHHRKNKHLRPIGPYDGLSIMNYCYHKHWSNRLSLGDIRTVNRIYRNQSY